MTDTQVKDARYWATYPLEVMARGHVLNDEELRLVCAALAETLSRAEAAEARLAEVETQRDAAIAALSEEGRKRGAVEAERDRLREALTPSGATKAEYMGEVECDCPTQSWRHHVPWTSIKRIMAMIRARAALTDAQEDRGND